MSVRILYFLVLLLVAPLLGVPSAGAEEASMRAKQFPTSYFYQFQKIPLAEKAKVLAKIDATLKKLNREGCGLIAKGAVIGKLSAAPKTYDKLTILDESGLIIIARQVPNLYYQYPNPAGINPNVYLIIKRARVNAPESYIRYGYVIEGDFAAYANKFVKAIFEGLEREGAGSERPPAPTPR